MECVCQGFNETTVLNSERWKTRYARTYEGTHARVYTCIQSRASHGSGVHRHIRDVCERRNYYHRPPPSPPATDRSAGRYVCGAVCAFGVSKGPPPTRPAAATPPILLMSTTPTINGFFRRQSVFYHLVECTIKKKKHTRASARMYLFSKLHCCFDTRCPREITKI